MSGYMYRSLTNLRPDITAPVADVRRAGVLVPSETWQGLLQIWFWDLHCTGGTGGARGFLLGPEPLAAVMRLSRNTEDFYLILPDVTVSEWNLYYNSK
jgi:hypothetical protein